MKKYWFLAVVIIGVFYDIGSQAGIIPAVIPQVVPIANKRGNATAFQLAGNTGTASAGTVFCDDGAGNTTTSGCSSGGPTGATGASGPGTVAWFAGSITPPVPGDWSSLGSGCTTSTVTGVGGGNALQVVSSSGAQNICGLKTSVAAGNFSHVFVIYAALSVPHFATVEAGFTDGSKAEYCGLASRGAPVDVLAGNQAQATALTGGSLSAANGVSTYTLPYPNGSGPMFFRLSRTGTNLACDYSPDGQTYFNIFNDTVPALTASAVYFAADPRGGSAISAGWLESYN